LGFFFDRQQQQGGGRGESGRVTPSTAYAARPFSSPRAMSISLRIFQPVCGQYEMLFSRCNTVFYTTFSFLKSGEFV
jgi:hypothetical protein